MTPEEQARAALETLISAAIPQAEHQRQGDLGPYERMQTRAAGLLAAREQVWTGPGCHENRLDRYLFWTGIEFAIAFLDAYGFDLSADALGQVRQNHELTKTSPYPRTFDDCRALLAFRDKRESLDKFGDAAAPDA